MYSLSDERWQLQIASMAIRIRARRGMVMRRSLVQSGLIVACRVESGRGAGREGHSNVGAGRGKN